MPTCATCACASARSRAPSASNRPTRPPARASAAKTSAVPSAVNSPEQYESFADKHPVGTKVKGVVESFASHGAYVRIADVAGYLPLHLMKSPAPRTPREHVKIGEQLALVVSGFNAARRSIEVSVLPLERSAPKAPRAPRQKTRPAPRSRTARVLRRRRRPD